MKKLLLLTTISLSIFSCKKDAGVGNAQMAAINTDPKVMPRVGGVEFNIEWNEFEDSTECYWVKLGVAKSTADLSSEKYAHSFEVFPSNRRAFIQSLVAGKYYYKAESRVMCSGRPTHTFTVTDSFTHNGGTIIKVPVKLN